MCPRPIGSLDPSRNAYAKGISSGLSFIGTQRCLDCPSSPIAELHTRAIEQNWTVAFTLNEPDLPGVGVSPADAAKWYIQWVNPLNISELDSYNRAVI